MYIVLLQLSDDKRVAAIRNSTNTDKVEQESDNSLCQHSFCLQHATIVVDNTQ